MPCYNNTSREDPRRNETERFHDSDDNQSNNKDNDQGRESPLPHRSNAPLLLPPPPSFLSSRRMNRPTANMTSQERSHQILNEALAIVDDTLQEQDYAGGIIGNPQTNMILRRSSQHRSTNFPPRQ